MHVRVCVCACVPIRMCVYCVHIRVCVSSISQCPPKEVLLESRDYTVCVSRVREAFENIFPREAQENIFPYSHLLRRHGQGGGNLHDYTVCVSRVREALENIFPREAEENIFPCSHLLRRHGQGGDPPLLPDLWLYLIALRLHKTPKIGPKIPPQDAPDTPKQTPQIGPQKGTQNETPYFSKMCPKPCVLLVFFCPQEISKLRYIFIFFPMHGVSSK